MNNRSSTTPIQKHLSLIFIETKYTLTFVLCMALVLLSPTVYPVDSSGTRNSNSALDTINQAALTSPRFSPENKRAITSDSDNIDEFSNKVHAVFRRSQVLTKPEKTSHLIILAENTISKNSQITSLKNPSKISQVLINKQTKYLKKSNDGKILGDDSETWSCVEDTNNGLTWEIKSSDGGLHDKNNSYTWFQPSLLEVVRGVANGGQCKGDSDCDTQSYVQTMNKKNYCGYSDWRLPTREEMLSIVSFESATSKLTINIDYFPDALPSWYWTGSSNENHPDHAWYVLFRNGIALNDLKERAKHVRLVRSINSTQQVKL